MALLLDLLFIWNVRNLLYTTCFIWQSIKTGNFTWWNHKPSLCGDAIGLTSFWLRLRFKVGTYAEAEYEGKWLPVLVNTVPSATNPNYVVEWQEYNKTGAISPFWVNKKKGQVSISFSFNPHVFGFEQTRVNQSVIILSSPTGTIVFLCDHNGTTMVRLCFYRTDPILKSHFLALPAALCRTRFYPTWPVTLSDPTRPDPSNQI